MSSNKQKTQTRYQVVTASSGKVVKNAKTREDARVWKRSSKSPQSYKIYDNLNQEYIS